MGKSKNNRSCSRKRVKKMNQAEIEVKINEINKLNDVDDFLVEFQPFRKYEIDGSFFEIQSLKSECLSHSDREFCVNLFELNMKRMYEESDWGYNKKEKKDELFDTDGRYLIVRDGKSGEPVAFVHFRFTLEDFVPMLYLYEIQILKAAQRKGLGKRLMQILELIARKNSLGGIMLTVFKDNTAALDFYRSRLKFNIDETSPSMSNDFDVCYEILSKLF